MTRLLCAACLLAAVIAAKPVFAADFVDSVTGQATMKTADDAAQCQKDAEAQLPDPRAKLQKKCEDDGGQFNYSVPTLSLHRGSCSVYQTVTCSGTGTPDPTQQAAKPADAKDDSSLPAPAALPEHRAKKTPARRKKAKKLPGDRQAEAPEKPAAGR